MDRQQALQTVRPLSPSSPRVPLPSPRGFSCLSDLEDGLVDGQPTPVNPKGEPRKAHNQRQMFERAFKDQKLTLNDLSPYRVRAAWRGVRWICVKLGVLDPDMLMGAMPEEAPGGVHGLDPLYRPLTSEQLAPPVPDRATRRLMEVVRQCEELGEEVEYEKLHDTESRIETAWKRGFTLLPTQETAGYWVKAFNIAAEHLFVSRGSTADRDQGRYGMLGLTDPETAALACPLLPEMLMWELFLVDQCVVLMASHGEHLIDASLREHYGLLPDETRPVLSQARRVIQERTDLDVGQQRAIMVLQIDDVMSRCREALDPRAELAALKLKSQITGITRSEPEDMKQMFRKIVQSSSERRHIDYAADNDMDVIDVAPTQTKEIS